MTMLNGREFEEKAVEYLKKNNYSILKRNFRSRVGEIDIIAKDGNTLVFVEVKGMNSNLPVENIDDRKIYRIRRTAESYLNMTKNWDSEVRFDVIILRMIEDMFSIEHIKEAF